MTQTLVTLDQFLINGATPTKEIYSPLKEVSLFNPDEDLEVKEFSGNTLVEDFWNFILQNNYYLSEDVSENQQINLPIICVFYDVVLTDWTPQYPGIFFTKYFWNQPEELKRKIKIVDQNINEDTNQILYYSLVKLKENFAHTDISSSIPLFVEREKSQEFDSIFHSNLHQFGSINIKKMKALLEKYEVTDYNTHPSENPILNFQLRILNFELDDEQEPRPLQGNLGVLFYNAGEIQLKNEHFWVGIQNFRDYLDTARNRLKQSIPTNAIILSDKCLFNNLILEVKSSFGSMVDELFDFFNRVKDFTIKANDINSVVVETTKREFFTNEFILGHILAPLCYYNALISIEINEPVISDPVQKKIFFHIRKRDKPNLNFWGFLIITYQNPDLGGEQ